jgi:hypothetical protein
VVEIGRGFFSGAFWSVAVNRFVLHKGIFV